MIFGLGLAFLNSRQEIIAVHYPNPLCEGDSAYDLINKHRFFDLPEGLSQLSEQKLAQIIAEIGTEAISAHFSEWIHYHAVLKSAKLQNRSIVLWYDKNDSPPADTAGAYLKLHLLSARKYKPHRLNLTGIFKVLPNNVWTSRGPLSPDDLPELRLRALLENNYLEVSSVDKFPKMTDFIVPSGVRIADTARVRLGAYVGENTTVMHEGFINFNAGTEGPNMVEGRISAGVFVGSGSDLGGGCSTMGTLSGGGNIIISVGKNCLIGANAGLGIPLGDNCVIESGLYITSGSVVSVLDKDRTEVGKVKAAQLAGQNDLLFRRHSQTGRIECLTKKNNVELNHELHHFN